MNNKIKYTSTNLTLLDINIHENTDYSVLLDKYKLNFISDETYHYVGHINNKYGWILHISCIKSQLIDLLTLLLPIFSIENISFKIVKNKETAQYILDGNFGYTHIGKIITIYPLNVDIALQIVKTLIKITTLFKGPTIPTDVHLGSIIYARYGAYKLKTRTHLNHNTKDSENNLADDYNIPFTLPSGIKWPFDSIKSFSTPTMPKLLNNKYKPISVIKPDAKGRVIKGLYFTNLFRIKPCIIKEGKMHMWSDDYGRGMKDRLLWQKQLHDKLGHDLPLPRVLDLFQENDDIYLALEYLKAISFDEFISLRCRDNYWEDVLALNKTSILRYLLEIIIIIEKLHAKGYVHRDITPVNFLIDKKNKIYLIDLELCYNLNDNSTTPPYQLGTFGFMSPQQQSAMTPTRHEDIFGLGCLMVAIFTGLSPLKFQFNSKAHTYQTLSNFTNSTLSDLITNCLSHDPLHRPELQLIYKTISNYITEIGTNEHTVATRNNNIINKDTLSDLIDSSIKGLINPIMCSAENIWLSQSGKNTSNLGTMQMNRSISPGFYSGISGILYGLALCELSGLGTIKSTQFYHLNWSYLESKYLRHIENEPPGLYGGTAGIALTLNKGINSGLLEDKKGILCQKLKSCLNRKNIGLTVATGIAGQGLSMLKCINVLGFEFTDIHLTEIIDLVLAAQQKDGSWRTETVNNRKHETILGFSYGCAGITYFLISYLFSKQENRIIVCVQKALSFLIKKSLKSNREYQWSTTTSQNIFDSSSIDYGIPGIALVFIKAYEYFKQPQYKNIAEEALNKIPIRPVRMDFTLATGLSGLGEVYLEAFRVFGNMQWQKRSEWITYLLHSTSITTGDGGKYWLPTINNFPTADLMSGNCGILHFLINYIQGSNSEFII